MLACKRSAANDNLNICNNREKGNFAFLKAKGEKHRRKIFKFFEKLGFPLTTKFKKKTYIPYFFALST
jgi:hypothetical protein